MRLRHPALHRASATRRTAPGIALDAKSSVPTASFRLSPRLPRREDHEQRHERRQVRELAAEQRREVPEREARVALGIGEAVDDHRPASPGFEGEDRRDHHEARGEPGPRRHGAPVRASGPGRIGHDERRQQEKPRDRRRRRRAGEQPRAGERGRTPMPAIRSFFGMRVRSRIAVSASTESYGDY